VPWVQVLEGDAAALPLENNRVDRARADRTLQDVEDPASVFAEIHRVLCPGGIAVVADFDWATISIDGDEEAGLAFNEYVITEAVRNAAIGRQLRRLTLGAGLEVVEVRQKPVLIDEFDYADKLLGLTDNMKRAAQAGYLAHAAGEQWLTHLQVGPFFAAIQMFIAVARKPGEVASAGR
jgi:ubiquinone/menaquinone biosynthesis C-methylase UbiE